MSIHYRSGLHVFAREPEVTEWITLFLMIVPLGYGLQGVVVLTNSALNAIHEPMQALALNALRLFVFCAFCIHWQYILRITWRFLGDSRC